MLAFKRPSNLQPHLSAEALMVLWSLVLFPFSPDFSCIFGVIGLASGSHVGSCCHVFLPTWSCHWNNYVDGRIKFIAMTVKYCLVVHHVIIHSTFVNSAFPN